MKITKNDLEELLEIHKHSSSITETAKTFCKKHGLEYTDSHRRRVSRVLRSFNEEEFIKGEDSDLENITTTETNQYSKKGNILTAINPETGKYMDIWKFCEYWEIPKHHVRTYKAVNSQNGGIPTYNFASHELKGEHFEEFYQKLLKEIEAINSRPKTIVRNKVKDEQGYLLIIDPCDVHIGKLCDSFETGKDYNSQIAVTRVREGVSGILDKTKGFRIEQILFVAGNDILHVDTPKRTTTSGTPQDTDGMWYRNFLMAKELYIEVLTALLDVADIHFVFNPSNHDYVHGFFLADVIQTYFKDCKNITFDCDISHRKYFRYFDNLIGTTHGDGGKIQDLPLAMAHESKDWSDCTRRYIYTHHVHHKTAKDYQGVAVESLRCPSPADSWHHRNIYDNNILAIEGYLHHPIHGQIARITHILD